MSVQVVLLWGEDDFAIARRIKQIEDQYGSQSERLFNVNHLEGRNISLDELKRELYSVPLFATRRLVVLSNVSSRFQNPSLREQFLEIISELPDSTELVLVEPIKLAADHWLIKWFMERRMSASITSYSLKKGLDMESWIRNQVKQAGGKMSPQAIVMLSGLIIDDSRMAHQEIDKLLTYVNFARRVETEDVEALCVSVGQGNVFAMVDALGNKDGRNALALLHELLEERDALSLFQMMVRQFRMILVARELMDSGGRVNDLASYFRLPGFVSKKIWSQARHFSLNAIENVFYRLLELDDRIKTGDLDDNLALEAVVAEFTSPMTRWSH